MSNSIDDLQSKIDKLNSSASKSMPGAKKTSSSSITGAERRENRLSFRKRSSSKK